MKSFVRKHVLHVNSGFPEIRNSSTFFTGIRNSREALQIFRIPVNSLRQFRIPVETTVIPDLSDCIAREYRISVILALETRTAATKPYAIADMPPHAGPLGRTDIQYDPEQYRDLLDWLFSKHKSQPSGNLIDAHDRVSLAAAEPCAHYSSSQNYRVSFSFSGFQRTDKSHHGDVGASAALDCGRQLEFEQLYSQVLWRQRTAV